jgi:hypothetical protein
VGDLIRDGRHLSCRECYRERDVDPATSGQLLALDDPAAEHLAGIVGDADHIGLAGLLLANGVISSTTWPASSVTSSTVKRSRSIERSMVSMAVENRAKSLKLPSASSVRLMSCTCSEVKGRF